MLADLSVFCLVYAHPRVIYFFLHFTEHSYLAQSIARHSHSQINESNFPPLNPQQQQVWDVGSQQLITLRAPPYFPANPF